MSTALPKIDQLGKPAGVGGLSRDDLDLYTVPGTEIQLSDVGVGAVSWLWSIIDQPPGAAAVISNPTAQITTLVGAMVAGSYLVQLSVDGGLLPGTVRRIIAGFQLDTPSWVAPPLNRPLRIPAKGETFEFNVESSPGGGLNVRGWAQEIDHWFRTLVAFGFGVRVQNVGVPVGAEPFYTLNFVGGGAVDAGGGVIDVTASFTPAHDLSNVPTPQTVVGIQSTPVDPTAPTDLQVIMFRSGPAQYVPTTITEDMIQPSFQITSFSTGVQPEVGQSVVTPAFAAGYSLPAPYTSVVLTDSEGTPAQNVTGTPFGFSSTGTFVKNTYGQTVVFTLTAVRDGFTRVRTNTMQWQRYVYWGGVSKPPPGGYTEAFIKALASNALTNTKNRTFNANGGASGSDVHIYYAYRAPYGASNFWVGGFSGGFTLVATVSVGTSAGPGVLAENYYLYESDQAGLGSTDVTVTD